jgi:hypothetical protein
MSHYRKIETTMNDREALVAALQVMGVEAEVHDKPVAIGQFKANVVVRKREIEKAGYGSYADIGWRFHSDGTVSEVIDEWPVHSRDHGRTTARVFVDDLRQPYAEARLMNVMREKVPDARIAQREVKDGVVRIRIAAERDVQTTAGVPGVSSGLSARK